MWIIETLFVALIASATTTFITYKFYDVRPKLPFRWQCDKCSFYVASTSNITNTMDGVIQAHKAFYHSS